MCDGMRNVILAAESTRQSVAELNTSNSLDRKGLIDEAKKAGSYRNTRLYRTIPVVAAWMTIQRVADSQGYAFRTPSFNPRNPRNTPRRTKRNC